MIPRSGGLHSRKTIPNRNEYIGLHNAIIARYTQLAVIRLQATHLVSGTRGQVFKGKESIEMVLFQL